MTGDVTGSELAEISQQSHVSVMGCNTARPRNSTIPWWYGSSKSFRSISSISKLRSAHLDMVEYLGLILLEGCVEMNLIKVAGVCDWLTLGNGMLKPMDILCCTCTWGDLYPLLMCVYPSKTIKNQP